MPKVSVYLPDRLYEAARARGLPISALAQQAIEAALRQQEVRTWVDRMRQRAARSAPLDTHGALDEVRSEFGA